jgi:hypothetical protein
MKLWRWLIVSLGIAIAGFMLNSCMKDEGYSLDDAWYSIATVRPLDSSTSYWMTLDSGTSLWPVATDVPGFQPKEKQRAFVIYTLLSDAFQGYDHAVKILDIKGILTKQIAKDLWEENDETYGTDPVEISEMWIGDGYLNIKFEFNYGGDEVHFINLMKNESVRNPELGNESARMPHMYEFRHNAYNDSERSKRKGIVAFDLSSVDTQGVDVELTIAVNTFGGAKEYKITYNSSKQMLLKNRDYSMDNYIEIK